MWTSVTILPRHQLTSQSVEVAVLPSIGRIDFVAGQFVVVELKLPSGIKRSAFSIVRREGRGIILGVKQRGDHGISAHLNALTGPIKASIAGPFGTFSLMEGFDEHVFITGGSGITPVRSLLDDLFSNGNVPTVIYGNPSAESAMYGASFRKLDERGYIRLFEVHDRKFKEVIALHAKPTAAFYICGPPGLVTESLAQLEAMGIPEDRITLERYGLDMGQMASSGQEFIWSNWWGRKRSIRTHGGESLLSAARKQDIIIPSACEVGVCGACEVHLKSGRVMCGKTESGPGEKVLACISQPVGTTPPVLHPSRRGRAATVSMALITAALSMGFWVFPPGVGLRSKGPMNTSHESLECKACHKEAEGTFRQQLGHNARTLLGLHGFDWVPVGFAEVDNAACISCHDRPDDLHPTARFMEMRFAEQRLTLGAHECTGCHGEHEGVRVANVGLGFCRECHSDLEVSFDPIQPSHAVLIEEDEWETCMQCHDFHGNHVAEVPKRLTDAIDRQSLLDYLKGGPDPYGTAKNHTATEDIP